MDARSLGTLRMILHAAARVLGCGSAQMALVDAELQALVMRVAVANRDVPRLEQISATLGFSPDGVHLPLASESSLLTRAVREGRLFVTGRFAELVGELVSDEVASQIQGMIGAHTFAVVPVLGRAGAIGVILFEKEGESGFSPTDRDLLVAYADRVGGELESQALGDDVAALGPLDEPAPAAPPPVIHLCDEQLVLTGGEAAGRPLAEALGAPAAALAEAVPRAGEGARTAAIAATDGRSIRVTLRRIPGGLVAVAEDVGWLDRLGREAARARRHLHGVLRAAGDAIFTVDTHRTIVGCNEAVRGAFGRAPSELLGRPLGELFADSRAAARAERIEKRLLAEGFAEGELTFRRADGRALPAAVSALLLADDEERPAGALWRLTDLTERRRGDAERKRLRARLLRSERLSALGEMAARIAHEVRNPLVSIGAAARVVEEELPPASPVSEEARAISREVRRLDGIVSDFLHFARPRKLLRSPVNLDALLRETVPMVQAKAPDARFYLSRSGETTARADADAIRQVLWNVLLNAVEASPAEGVVECDVRAVGGKVVVSIADSGPGVPPAVRRRLFDPFFSTKARGTGLGLAVSKQIVDEHRGRLRLFNRATGGTRVVVEIPV
jgi:PAS domain S-box-containing protein